MDLVQWDTLFQHVYSCLQDLRDETNDPGPLFEILQQPMELVLAEGRPSYSKGLQTFVDVTLPTVVEAVLHRATSPSHVKNCVSFLGQVLQVAVEVSIDDGGLNLLMAVFQVLGANVAPRFWIPEAKASILLPRLYRDHGRPKQMLVNHRQVYAWPKEAPALALTNSEHDVGLQIKIHWSKYNCHYHGKICGFDSTSGLHTVRYDDGDVREYLLERKEFILIEPPKTAGKQKEGVSSAKLPLGEDKRKARVFCQRPDAGMGFDLSLHLIELINIFGTCGGFDRICDRFEKLSEQPMDFAGLRMRLRLVHMLRTRLEADKFKEIAWTIKEFLPSALLDLKDTDVRSLDTAALTSFLALLHDVFVSADGPAAQGAVRHSMRLLNLELHYKLLCSSSLAARLAGLVFIRESVESAAHKHKPASDLKFLLDWLTLKGFVEELLGESLHLELVKRASSVLKLLTESGRITRPHLVALWACACSTHEAVERVLFALISDLVPVLSNSLRRFLFSQIESTPMESYTASTLQLIFTFTTKAVKRHGEMVIGTEASSPFSSSSSAPAVTSSSFEVTARRGRVSQGSISVVEGDSYGFTLLWYFILGGPEGESSAATAAELTELAASLLVKLATQCPYFSGERDGLVQRCVENLRHHCAVEASLLVLRGLLKSLPPRRKGAWGGAFAGSNSRDADGSLAGALELLERSHGLLDAFFKDTKVSLPCCRPRARKRAVATRLKFLTFVLRNSALALTQEQVSAFWQCLVDGALDPECGALAVAWVGDACASTASLDAALGADADLDEREGATYAMKALAEGVIDYLFEVKLAKVQASTVSAELARLYLQLFVEVNSRPSKALRSPNPAAGESGEWVRQLSELQGENMLWDIACQTSDPAISEEYMQLLVELPHRTSKMSRNRTDKIWTDFVRTCLHRISMAVSVMPHLGADDSSGSAVLALQNTKKSKSAPRQEGRVGGLVEHHDDDNGADSDDDTPRPNESSKKFDAALYVWRCVQLLERFLGRFSEKPQRTVVVEVLAGRSGDSKATEVTLDASSTVRELRAQVARHFNEQASRITLKRAPLPAAAGYRFVATSLASSSSTSESAVLDDDDATMDELRFATRARVVAEKKQSNTASASSAQGAGEKTADRSGEDLFHPKDLESSHTDVFLGWMLAQSEEEGTAFSAGPASCRVGQSLPPPPLPFKADMTLAAGEALPPALLDQGKLTTAETAGSASAVLLPGQAPVELGPTHLDQLQELLDLRLEESDPSRRGFDISGGVWRVLRQLPTHHLLLKDLRSLNGALEGKWSGLLDPTSTYKFLGALNVVDAFLTAGAALAAADAAASSVSPSTNNMFSKSSSSSSSSSAEQHTQWALRFIGTGGIEQLVRGLSVVSSELATESNGDDASEPTTTSSSSSSSSGGAVLGTASSTHAPASAAAAAVSSSGSRGDAKVLCIALAHRVLFQLLGLDPLFYAAAEASTASERRGNRGSGGSSGGGAQGVLKAPPGTVLGMVDLAALVTTAMRTLESAVTTMAKRNRPASGVAPGNAASSSSARVCATLASHTMTLVVACTRGSSAARTAVAKYTSLPSSSSSSSASSSSGLKGGGGGLDAWLASLTLKAEHACVRSVVCASLLAMCAAEPTSLCGTGDDDDDDDDEEDDDEEEEGGKDSGDSDGDDEDGQSRMRGVCSVDVDPAGSSNRGHSSRQQLSSSLPLSSPTPPSPPPPSSLCLCMFNKLVTLLKAVSSSSTHRQHRQQSSELFGLVAGLVALLTWPRDSAPRRKEVVLALPPLPPPPPLPLMLLLQERGCGSNPSLLGSSSSGGGEGGGRADKGKQPSQQCLCDLASSLLSSLSLHPASTESATESASSSPHHCSSFDPVLVGLLRLLGALAHGSPHAKASISRASVTTATHGGDTSTVRFLYRECLFPTVAATSSSSSSMAVLGSGNEANNHNGGGALVFGARCESVASRAAAYALLVELSSPNGGQGEGQGEGEDAHRHERTRAKCLKELLQLLRMSTSVVAATGTTGTRANLGGGTGGLNSAGGEKSGGGAAAVATTVATTVAAVGAAGWFKPRAPCAPRDDLQTLTATATAAAAAVPPNNTPTKEKSSPLMDEIGGASIRPSHHWSYDPRKQLKLPWQAVGLKNQGATCYMNSFLQQLFHAPQFSSGLVAIDATTTTATATTTADVAATPQPPSINSGGGSGGGGDNDDLRLVRELQKVFGVLSSSSKKYHDALGFCNRFLDYDGGPVALGEQKDAYEFASMLFDKLESSQHPAVKKLVADRFGGRLCYQVLSSPTTTARIATKKTEAPGERGGEKEEGPGLEKEAMKEEEDTTTPLPAELCTAQQRVLSEREEPYYMLTADVKNKSSLEASLSFFVAGEPLAGEDQYEHEDGSKTDAVRKCSLVASALPPTLVFHLKRFDYNLETYTKVKVNDYFSFPMEMDMSDYVMEKEGVCANGNNLPPGAGASADVSGVAAAAAAPAAAAAAAAGGDEDEGNEGNEGGGTTTTKATASGMLYRLKGIVAHTGTSESGHYYSFIASRDGDNDGSAGGGSAGGGCGDPVAMTAAEDNQAHQKKEVTWREYNDKQVLPFDCKNIPRECFGGEEEEFPDERGGAASAAPPAGEQGPGKKSRRRVRNNNAYLLFYDRVDTTHSSNGSNDDAAGGGENVALDRPSQDDGAGSSSSSSRRSRSGNSGSGKAVQSDLDSGASAAFPTNDDGGGGGDDQGGGAGKELQEQHHHGHRHLEKRGKSPMHPTVVREVFTHSLAFLNDTHAFHRDYFKFVWRLMLLSSSPSSPPPPPPSSLALAHSPRTSPASLSSSSIPPPSAADSLPHVFSPLAPPLPVPSFSSFSSSSSSAAAAAIRQFSLQASLRFVVEVLAHAHVNPDCVPVWCQAIEDSLLPSPPPPPPPPVVLPPLPLPLACAVGKEKVQETDKTTAQPNKGRQGVNEGAAAAGAAAACVWALQALAEPGGRPWLEQMLVTCPHPESRDAFRNLLLRILLVAASPPPVLSPPSASSPSSSSSLTQRLGGCNDDDDDNDPVYDKEPAASDATLALLNAANASTAAATVQATATATASGGGERTPPTKPSRKQNTIQVARAAAAAVRGFVGAVLGLLEGSLADEYPMTTVLSFLLQVAETRSPLRLPKMSFTPPPTSPFTATDAAAATNATTSALGETGSDGGGGGTRRIGGTSGDSESRSGGVEEEAGGGALLLLSLGAPHRCVRYGLPLLTRGDPCLYPLTRMLALVAASYGGGGAGGGSQEFLDAESEAALLDPLWLKGTLRWCPEEAGMLMKSLCWRCNSPRAFTLYKFLVEQVLDATHGQTMPSYKPPFVLLAGLLGMGDDHGGGGDDDDNGDGDADGDADGGNRNNGDSSGGHDPQTDAPRSSSSSSSTQQHSNSSFVMKRAQFCLAPLTARCARLVERQASGDGDFVYDVTRLVLWVGAHVPEAAAEGGITERFLQNLAQWRRQYLI